MKYFFLCLLCTIISVSGCSSFDCRLTSDKSDIKFSVPILNENDELLPEIDYWEIEVQCGSHFFPNPQKRSLNPGDCFYLQINESSPTSVLAFPHIKGQKEGFRFFHPCGTIFPYSNNLTWENGFTAELLRDFYIHSILAGNSSETSIQFASRFNWEKLCNSISAKYSENKDSVYNPYFLDRNKILSSIENESFSDSFLNVKKLKEFSTLDLKQNLIKKYNDELLDSNFSIYSKYIPENTKIISSGSFSYMQTEEFQLLGFSAEYGSFLCFADFSSAKKLSLRKLNL